MSERIKGQQTCRRLIDRGVIGRPVAGTAFMLSHGHESWHPNPAFYYLDGGGPLFDMGPYYLTALIHLLGPVRRVCASAARTFGERTITSQPLAGTRIPVEVPTHVSGTLDFRNGAVVTLVMSFDVWKHSNYDIQIHGERGSMKVPDPNGFGGPVSVCGAGEPEWQDAPLCSDHVANLRGFGVDDLVRAIRDGRQSRWRPEPLPEGLRVGP
jgi:predicted dehydrogenase